MYSDWERDPEVRKGIRPVLADMGHTTQFLASRAIALTNNAHALFLDFALDNYIQALLLLQRRARGDYEPDELPKSFPKFAPQRQRTATGLSPRELFDAWVKARQPAPGTIESWSVVFNALTQDFPNRPEHERLAQQVERDLIAHRCANPLKIEAAPCHFAGVVSRQTSSANIRSCSVDRACRRDAYVSHKRCTAITAASHASMFAIGIRAGDSIEIGVAFQ
jgi:hypothetical protein